jgi:hypothetical protein
VLCNTCNTCYYYAPTEEFEAAATAYDLIHGPSSYDERCPKCDEPRRAVYDDYYDPPEPEPSELDVFIQEVFQAGDEEALADHAEDT